MRIIPPVIKLYSGSGIQIAEAAMCANSGMINHSYLKAIPGISTVTNRQLWIGIECSTAASTCT